MKVLTGLVAIITLLTSCQEKKALPLADVHRPTVFEAVIADLVAKEAVSPKFVGSKAMVVADWNNGDSLFYSLDDELTISDELLESLQSESKSKEPFPDAGAFGPLAVMTKDPPLNYLEYYDEDAEPVQARCYLSFWRPGYSKDGRHAIVRVWYGPDSHDAVGTYLLDVSDSGWKVSGATLSVYP